MNRKDTRSKETIEENKVGRTVVKEEEGIGKKTGTNR